MDSLLSAGLYCVEQNFCIVHNQIQNNIYRHLCWVSLGNRCMQAISYHHWSFLSSRLLYYYIVYTTLFDFC